MDLSPRHRIPLRIPPPWEALLHGCLQAGALWLHSGDQKESLLAWTGPQLTSHWEGAHWVSRLDGEVQAQSPWLALEAALPTQAGPWIGAATFELACDEAGLPRKALPSGQLGQHWAAVQDALHWKDGGLEWLSWAADPPDPREWTARLALAAAPPAGPRSRPRLSLTPVWDHGTHREAVAHIQSRILEGGFYVANLCVPFQGSLQETVEHLALRALKRARPPFGALLNLEGTSLLSLSMERLLARRGDHLWSQPIKGSTPLTGDTERDQKAARSLSADPKERAEHTMILDLVRNDLGRVALPGSVRVSQSMAVVPYPTVQHLVSRVEAQARPGLGLAELLRAVLPGGSVTGAPKQAVCGHLAAAEAAPRGFYCGALGWISRHGDLDLALPIRTAQIQGDRLTYWTGGGITLLSDPEREWEELFLKTRAITG